MLWSTHMDLVSYNWITKIPFGKTNDLPILHAYNSSATTTVAETHNAGVLVEQSINLTASQKELMSWHFHLFHERFDSLQCLLGQANLHPLL